jgi:hypothetical protein
MKKGKYIIISLCLLFLIYIGYIFCIGYNFTGDIYRHSEQYIVDNSYNKLIGKINKFKEDNPEYYLITSNEKGERITYQDNRSNKYYHVFFYFKNINLTIQCLLSPIDDNKSYLALYAVSTGVNFASWEVVNTKDLSKEDNRDIKKKFESEILDKLGKWKRMYWYNDFFRIY